MINNRMNESDAAKCHQHELCIYGPDDWLAVAIDLTDEQAATIYAALGLNSVDENTVGSEHLVPRVYIGQVSRADLNVGSGHWKSEYVQLADWLEMFAQKHLPPMKIIPSDDEPSGAVAVVLKHHINRCRELLMAECMNCDAAYVDECLLLLREQGKL
jgi:hypothetical protein